MDTSNTYDVKEVLKDVISKIPLMYTDKLYENLWIKTENLQGTDAFKLRGAYHKLHSLTQKEREKGVIATSVGDHTQRAVYSCVRMGIKGAITMPRTAPLSKIEATRSYSVAVELQGDTFSGVYEYARNLQEITSVVFVEPSDDEYVIAGQGTIGLEILDKLSDVDTVIVPISGGGPISRIATAIKAMRPSCCIIGVQSEYAPSTKQSLEKKEIIKLQNVSTIADGIAVKTPGKLTYKLCSKYVDEVATANEEGITAVVLTLLEKMKTVVEGAGATSVAVAILGKVDLKYHRCVAVLSGGNIDVNLLSKVIDLDLMKTGRRVVINMNVMDKPGNLSRMIELISRTGVNTTPVSHNRIQNAMLFNQCRVGVTIKTNDNKRIENVLVILRNNGHDLHPVEHI